MPALPAGVIQADVLRLRLEAQRISHPVARDFVWWTMLTVADARRGLELARPFLERVSMLWGSDSSPPGPESHVAWQQFQAVSLTQAEFVAIARNVAPYLR